MSLDVIACGIKLMELLTYIFELVFSNWFQNRILFFEIFLKVFLGDSNALLFELLFLDSFMICVLKIEIYVEI